MNLVLDDVQEMLRGTSVAVSTSSIFTSTFPSQPCTFILRRTCRLILAADDEGNTSTRSLGLIVARGTLLVLISPLDGSEEIANPFNNPEDD